MAKTILLIEDEKILAEMYKDRFVQERFNVLMASSAEEGLEVLKKKKPDLILLDILLPKENGISFLEKREKIKNAKSIPVVAFSNYDDPETKKRARELGVKDYLIKTGFTPDQIVEKVKTYL